MHDMQRDIMAAPRSLAVTLSAGLIGLVLAACTSAATPAPSAAPVGGGAGAGGATVSTASSSMGTVLAGPTGMTLYTYAKDSMNTSACTGGCATAWPPLTVPAGQQPTAGAGVTGTLATFARPDGTAQVSYNGQPLYYWQGDKAAGDVTGNGVNSFSIATPSGAGAAPSGAPAASPSGVKPGY
jgi:predicted lipoprotein with Yx(FWY)xxD motif